MISEFLTVRIGDQQQKSEFYNAFSVPLPQWQADMVDKIDYIEFDESDKQRFQSFVDLDLSSKDEL